jgi:hypothetical protein
MSFKAFLRFTSSFTSDLSLGRKLSSLARGVLALEPKGFAPAIAHFWPLTRGD